MLQQYKAMPRRILYQLCTLYIGILYVYTSAPVLAFNPDENYPVECEKIAILIQEKEVTSALEVSHRGEPKKCAMILLEKIYQEGRMDEARHEAAFLIKYMDRSWEEYYYKTLYYGLLLDLFEHSDVDIYLDELRMHSSTLANDIVNKHQEKIRSKIETCLEPPGDSSCAKITAFWLKQFGIQKEKYDRYIHLANKYDTIFETPINPSSVRDARNILESIKSLNFTLDGSLYPNGIEEIDIVFEHLHNYFVIIRKSEKEESNAEKSKHYEQALDIIGKARGVETHKNIQIPDNERTVSLFKKYRILAEMDYFINNEFQSIPSHDHAFSWYNSSIDLPDDIGLPHDKQSIINILHAYYELPPISEIFGACQNEYYDFSIRYEQEYHSGYQAVAYLLESLKNEIKNRLSFFLSDMSDEIETDIITGNSTWKLLNIKERLVCLSQSFSELFPNEETTRTIFVYQDLIDYKINKINGNISVANRILNTIPIEIMNRNDLHPVLNCSEQVANIRIVMEGGGSEYHDLSFIEKLKTASKIPPEENDRNECYMQKSTGYGELRDELSEQFFAKRMNDAYEMLEFNNLNNGEQILDEILTEEYYIYPESDARYKYAYSKMKLFNALKDNATYEHISKYFDENISNRNLGRRYDFFYGEKEIVERLINSRVEKLATQKDVSDKSEIDAIEKAAKPDDLPVFDADKTISEKDYTVSEKASANFSENSPFPMDSNNDKTYKNKKNASKKSREKVIEMFDFCIENLTDRRFEEASKCFQDYLIYESLPSEITRAAILKKLSDYLSIYYENARFDLDRYHEILIHLKPKDKKRLADLLESYKNNLRIYSHAIRKWLNILKEEEGYLYDFEYEKAVAYFKKKEREKAEKQEISFWIKRKQHAELLWTIERQSRKHGYSLLGTKRYNHFLNNRFERDDLRNHGTPFLISMDGSHTYEETMNRHKKHMNFVFWLSFGDKRFKQGRIDDAQENYQFALKDAQTIKEKDTVEKKLKRIAHKKMVSKTTRMDKPISQDYADFLKLKKNLIVKIQQITLNALDEKIITEDIDNMMDVLYRFDNSISKYGLKKKDLDEIFFELYNANQTIWETFEDSVAARRLIIRMKIKIKKSELWNTINEKLEGRKKLMDFWNMME